MCAVRTQDERRTLVPTSETPPRDDFFGFPTFAGLDICSCYVLIADMTDRPARWRMPTPKQMEKLAAAAAARGNGAPTPTPGAGDEMPPEYWQAVLDEAETDRGTPGPS